MASTMLAAVEFSVVTTVLHIKPDATDTLHQHAFPKFIASRARENIKDYHHGITSIFENVKE